MSETDADPFELVLVATPWYPTTENPVWGVFVRDAVVALGRHVEGRVQVVHVDSSPLTDAERAEGRGEDDSWAVDEVRPEADVRVVRRPYPPETSRGRAMELHREALAEHADDLLQRAKYVCAHVGGPTGAAVAPLLPRRARFTIIEHASYVRAIFDDLGAATAYRAAVARAARVLAVSDVTAATLRRLCPQQADIISAAPNPVDIDRLPLREVSSGRRDRWLYVGTVAEHKGVHRLVDAFAEEVRETGDARPELHLTIAGDGPSLPDLEEQIHSEGLEDRVTLLGLVRPEDVPPLYAGHDVLVHLSRHETFGLTAVEAAACGLPVVMTRCGGPQETMIVPEGVGTAVLVPRIPPLDQVREAVREVRVDASTEDLVRIRAALRQLYGLERSADLQCKYVLGRVPAPATAEPVDLTLLLIFQGPRQWQRLRHGADRAADLGARVLAVDLEDRMGVYPAGITRVSPGSPDRYNVAREVERAVVDRAPRTALRVSGKAAARLPERLAAPAGRVLTSAAQVHDRVSTVSEQKVYGRFWRAVRGQVIARRVQRQPELATLRRLDALVHTGGRMTQLAYRVAVRHPEAQVHGGPFTATHLALWWVRAGARSAAQAGTVVR